MIAVFDFPLRTVPGVNLREHWAVKAKRVARERAIAALAFRAMIADLAGIGRADVVTFTRIAPRLVDSDNLQNAFKATRDELAAFLGVSDAPRGGVDWRYAQERGPPTKRGIPPYYGVRIEVEITSGETSKVPPDSGDLSSVGRDATVPPPVVSDAPPRGTPSVVGCVDDARGPRFSRRRGQEQADGNTGRGTRRRGDRERL